MIFLLLPHISFALWSHFRLLMQPDASWIIWLHANCHFPVISLLIQLLLQFNIIQWLNQDQITSLHLWRTILPRSAIMYKNGSIVLSRYPALILMTFPAPFWHALVMLAKPGWKNPPWHKHGLRNSVPLTVKGVQSFTDTLTDGPSKEEFLKSEMDLS